MLEVSHTRLGVDRRAFLDIEIPLGYDFSAVTPTFRQDRLRKVQPFLISDHLARSLETVVEAMTSPMSPRVTLASAVRELLVSGCDLIEAELTSSKQVTWTVADPPRGPRRQEARTTARDARVATDSYQQLSPVSLPEPLIERVHHLVERVTALMGVTTTLTKVMREALSRACAERERVRRASETFVREHAALLALAGFPNPAQLKVVALGVTIRMPPPRPAKKPRPEKAASIPAKTSTSPKAPSTAGRLRGRAPRRKTTSRRVIKGADGSDDGDGDGPSGPAARRPSESPITGRRS